MYHHCRFVILISLFVTLFSTCSFNYGDGIDTSNLIPEMVMQEATADRYENALLSINITARSLELYDADRIWVAEDISFVQYSDDGKGTVESEGSAGLLLVDDASEVYSLGASTSVHLISDNLFLSAPDLRWSKKTNRLSGSETGEVEIIKDDGSSICGTGFFADTLSRSYQFEQSVNGQIVTGEPSVAETAPEAASETMVEDSMSQDIMSLEE